MMTDTLPQLRQAGFTDQDIHTFLVDNPRKFFAQTGKI
jgi:predicted metal-dependent phosphotriesterase family hydrolase